MIDKLLKLVERYDILSEKMSNPDIISDMDQYTALAKEHRQLLSLIHI